MKFLCLLALPVSLLLSQAGFSKVIQSCAVDSVAQVSFKYCVTKSSESKSKDILYYFHGGGGDESGWLELSSKFYEGWETKGLDVPAVITISFGEIWLLVEKNELPTSGLLNLFVAGIAPKLETMVLGAPPAKRFAIGLSMGGFNLTQLLQLGSRGLKFDNVALLCPALIALTPWAPQSEIDRFITKTGADPETVANVVEIGKSFVPNAMVWGEQVDPFENLSKVTKESSPKIILIVNSNDFTFRSGGLEYASRANALKLPLLSMEWPGGHCNIDEAKMTEFTSEWFL